MGRFQKSIEVHAPVSECYHQWMKFEEFPRFMAHVRSITKIDTNVLHWVVDGPMGQKLEWDAEIDGNEVNRAISWHTVGKPDVGLQGAVLFEELNPEHTRIIATIQYQPPVGAAGEALGKVFSNPEKMIAQGLENFKNLIEQKAGTATLYHL